MPKYARKTPSTRLPELIKTGKIKGNSEHLLTNRSQVRVPSGELNSVSELSPTARLTENAESVPLGVFLWTPVFRRISDTTANFPDVSGSLFNSGSPTDPPGGRMRLAKMWAKTL
jgi:hypothetical protein